MRVILQVEVTECALACVAMIADHYGFRTELENLREKIGPSVDLHRKLTHLAA
jgi:ATP-binding cassette subfamily B protein RaxB